MEPSNPPPPSLINRNARNEIKIKTNPPYNEEYSLACPSHHETYRGVRSSRERKVMACGVETGLCCVYERGAFQVSDNVSNSTLDVVDFICDRTTFCDRGGGLGLAVAVDMGCGFGGR
jgi:hypothetical protein